MTDTLTPAAPAAKKSGPWHLTLTGVMLIAALELKQRVRSTKWIWALGAFFVLVGAVTLLLTWAIESDPYMDDSGDITFGVVVFFVLFLGLLVSPTLSATAINGDNRDGTLAPLQATALSAVDIVLGKLLGAWVASLAFLVVAIPFILFTFFTSDPPIGAVVVTVLVLAVQLLVVCAIGLGWSALTSRTPASAVLSFVSVATLTVLTLVFFGLTYPLLSQEATVRAYEMNYNDGPYREVVRSEMDADGNWVDYDADGEVIDYEADYHAAYECGWTEYEMTVSRTDRSWWLLALNPFVIVADAAPSRDDSSQSLYSDQTMLGSIKYAVRDARLGPELVVDYCWSEESQLMPEFAQRREDMVALGPVWPFGLGAHVLLAAGAVMLAVRRVSVPYGVMPKGMRVA